MEQGAEQGVWLAQVEREHENLLSALESCALATVDAEQALQHARNLLSTCQVAGCMEWRASG